MSEPHVLLALRVNDARRLRCLLHRYREGRWLGPEDGTNGWGVGRYVSGRAMLRTQPGRPPTDLSPAGLLDDETDTTILIAHASSPPAPRPGPDAVQPLRFRRWLFAEQGVVDLGQRRADILADLPQFLQRGQGGQSDAEILSLHFMAQLYAEELLDGRPSADDVWHCLREAMAVAAEPHNVVTSNGNLLLAYRAGGPLYYCGVDGMDDCERCWPRGTSTKLAQLVASHQRFKGVCVASRPFEAAGLWQQIPAGQALAIDAAGDVRLMSTSD